MDDIHSDTPDHNGPPGKAPPAIKVIRAAADELVDAMVLKSAELVDKILGRPELGSDEWQKEVATRHTAAGRRRMQEWYLVKLAILREAQLGPRGVVLNARRVGATWEAIGRAWGVTAHQAEAQWGPLQHLAVKDLHNAAAGEDLG